LIASGAVAVIRAEGASSKLRRKCQVNFAVEANDLHIIGGIYSGISVIISPIMDILRLTPQYIRHILHYTAGGQYGQRE
jgi:hypothetical protein